tara:strand:+ start:1190 stop:1435 length:246 start_codon:yes stop_codon:yes gene_type:complete
MISCLTFTLGFSAGLGVSIISFSLSVIAPATLQEVNPIEYARSKGEDVQFDNRGYRCIEIRRVKTIKEAKELVNLYKDLSK